MKVDLVSTPYVLMFPGQGAQYVGMGAKLLRSPSARRVVEQVEDLTGVAVARLATGGPATELDRTSTTQPCTYALSLAAVAVLREHLGGDGSLVACAGHSAGHFAALTIAGALSLEAGARLVMLRGALMEQAQGRAPGAMAAVNLDEETARAWLPPSGEVVLANVNGPEQVVISGPRSAVLAALETLPTRTRSRVLPVKVAAHSPLMDEAAERFTAALRQVPMADATVPISMNDTGQLVFDAEELRANLAAHLSMPVHWRSVLIRLATRATAFVDCGPGQTLARLVGQNLNDAQAVAIGFLQGVDELVAAPRMRHT